ncbi:uncharacterized protein YkwD [Motilibacter rhizosphaerae]|uniref:Uncharacterized protein YkwD n=1 Tax=Motilibacter rhizosphaerae TaxID=598652 RepID=A0A4Q7NAW4_9ACTN|nr:CAP domain-containing protein [Motilibacter rhizosphaerae]RZS80091.1 uncharacterized protein YkwD [Motilibacter rhizosphaerae]
MRPESSRPSRRLLAGMVGMVGMVALLPLGQALPAHAATSPAAAALGTASAATPAVTSSTTSRASARASAVRTLLVQINRERAAHHLRPLRLSRDLTVYAGRHSVDMAVPRRLVHSTGLSTLCCWTRIGENVAYAVTPQIAGATLLASPPHRANILTPQFTEIGIGVARSGGRIWVTEVFRARR